MARYTISLPNGLNDEIESFVDDEEQFTSKAEAIRYCVRNQLQREENHE